MGVSRKQYLILAQLGYDDKEIEQMTTESAYDIIAKEGINENIGFHYGNLGKAEKMNEKVGYSDTGHYGTGTYFASLPERPGYKRYTDRPLKMVSFDGYKLYKPEDNETAKKLHDSLKAINEMESYDLKNLEKDLFDEYMKLDTTNKDNTMMYLIRHQAWSEDYEDFSPKELANIASLVYNEDVSRQHKQSDAIFNLSLLIGDTETNTYEMVKNAIKDTTNVEDSKSTKFMKAAGYEGVDVRHLNKDDQGLQGFDNFEYGSVIYDLKPESEIKKRERVTKQDKAYKMPASNKEWLEKNFPGYKVAEIDVNQAIEDNNILKDNAVLNRRTERWGYKYGDYKLDKDKVDWTTSDPIRVTTRNGKLKIDDGMHRMVAFKNAGYKTIEALVRKGE